MGGFGRLLVRQAVPVSRKWKATWAASASLRLPLSCLLGFLLFDYVEARIYVANTTLIRCLANDLSLTIKKE